MIHKYNYINTVLGFNFLTLVLFKTLQNVIHFENIQSYDVRRQPTPSSSNGNGTNKTYSSVPRTRVQLLNSQRKTSER